MLPVRWIEIAMKAWTSISCFFFTQPTPPLVMKCCPLSLKGNKRHRAKTGGGACFWARKPCEQRQNKKLGNSIIPSHRYFSNDEYFRPRYRIKIYKWHLQNVCVCFFFLSFNVFWKWWLNCRLNRCCMLGFYLFIYFKYMGTISLENI